MPSGRGGKDFYLFAKRVKRYSRDIPRLANEYKKALAEEALRQIVADTPLDSGEARSNYFAALGAPDRTSRRAGPFDRSGNVSISAGIAVIDRAAPGQSIHLTNTAPHAGLLNEGWSNQAPAGFVEMAVDRARFVVARQMYKAFRMP